MVNETETVTPERLTRFYLANHFLTAKTEKHKMVDVAGTVCGLHAQVPLTPYLSLWSRVNDFEAEQLDPALFKERRLVKTWFMRGTLHIIPSSDLPIYHNALRRMWFEHHGRYMHDPGWPSEEDREKLLYPKILEALQGKPLRRKELSDKVRLLLKDKARPYEWIFSSWGGILKETGYLGLTVHAEPCGKESCFARLDEWLPNISLKAMSETQARRELFLRYLACYGPASAQDFSCWSGMLTSEARTIAESCGEALTEVQVERSGSRLWMRKKDMRTLQRIDLDEEVPPRLLPKYDSYLLGHKDRARIIDEGLQRRVFRPVVGDIAATVLVNGRIAGTWTHKKTRKALTISVTPLEKIGKQCTSELKELVDELGVFMKVEKTRMLMTH